MDGGEDMAVIVNNPPEQQTQPQNTGPAVFLVGILIFLAIVVLFFMFVLPFIQRGFSTPNVSVNVPKDVNVHVNK